MTYGGTEPYGYDDSRYGAGADTGYLAQSSYPQAATGVGRPVTEAELDRVFGELDDSPRDATIVHVLVELLLAVVLVGVAALLWQADHAALAGPGLLLAVASLGLLASAIGLTLRLGAVNLAVGPIGVAAGVYLATHADSGTVPAVATAVAAAMGLGLLMALVVVVLRVPGWAVSLATSLLVAVWLGRHATVVHLPTSVYRPAGQASYWLMGAVGFSVVGGLVGALTSVRRTAERAVTGTDSSSRRGSAAVAFILVALPTSAGLAALGGMLAGLASRSVVTTAGPGLTALALGAALLGGTSAWGRRGGVFGTALATGVIVVAIRYAAASGHHASDLAWGAGAIGLGLVVTRLLESVRRPRVSAESRDRGADSESADSLGTSAAEFSWPETRIEPWTDQSAPATGGWSSQSAPATGGWSSQSAPATGGWSSQSAPATGGWSGHQGWADQ